MGWLRFILPKVKVRLWLIGLLLLSEGPFAQEDEEIDSQAKWEQLRGLRQRRPVFWVGPLRNKAVHGIGLTPIGFRKS